jgi:C4-dicarboxylate-specific signal transduction histidine kinase
MLLSVAWISHAQVDSLQFSKELNVIKKAITNLKYTAYQQNQIQQSMSDSLSVLHQTQQEGNRQLLDELSRNLEKLDAIRSDLNNINGETIQLNDQQQRNFMINYLLHGFSLALFIFLIVYILIQRRRSLDFLLARANNLAGQNNEILEKAEELKSIKKSLKEVMEHQKKANKALKKKKK